MVPYDAGDHFEQIFLLYVDAGGRSLLIGDCLENCWLATSNSCISSQAAFLVFYAAEINFALLFWSIDLISKKPFRYLFILV